MFGHKLALLTMAALFAAVLGGCFANTNQYHTAETLEPGELSMGGAIYVTDLKTMCVEVKNAEDQTVRECVDFDNDVFQSFELFLITPDYFVRYGIIEDLEIGGRLNYVGGAIDLKWRFLDTPHFDLAIDPALRLFFPFFGFVREIGVDLPLLFSVRAADWFQFYGGTHGLIGYWHVPYASDADANLTAFGFSANAGVSFEIGSVFIRPEFSYNNYVTGVAVSDEDVGSIEFEYYNIGVGIGGRFGGNATKNSDGDTVLSILDL